MHGIKLDHICLPEVFLMIIIFKVFARRDFKYKVIWLSTEEQMLSNCSAGEDSWESVPSTASISNQSILKEINPEYSLGRLMLKLKLQYLGHLMWRTDSLEKTLTLGKTEGKRKSGRQRIRWLDSINSMDINLSKLQEPVKGREAWHGAVHGITKSDTT